MAARLGSFILTLTLGSLLCQVTSGDEKDPNDEKTRYILYDVNPGEGFNLRRDVYMRMAVWVRSLNLQTGTRWVLVLPPWSHLYHWQNRVLYQGRHNAIPWKAFFDVEQMNHYVPVMELKTWMKKVGGKLDAVHYLQGYKEGWGEKFEEKFDVRDCLEPARYKLGSDGKYHGHASFAEVYAEKFQCLSVQGRASVLTKLVSESQDQSIMLDRAENLLHEFFGDADYWAARRSMKFSDRLVAAAQDFRDKNLEYVEDAEAESHYLDNWWEHSAQRKEGRGGNYAAVHMRRADFARSRGDQVPSVEWVGKQLAPRLRERKLDTLYVATDGTDQEVNTLGDNLPGVRIVRFKPTERQLKWYKDGGVAIIDQVICSYAQYFVGTRESTFTFRIQEEREMLGFTLEDTFAMLCKDGEMECEGGIRWKIDWGGDKDWRLYPEPEDEEEEEEDSQKDRSEL